MNKQHHISSDLIVNLFRWRDDWCLGVSMPSRFEDDKHMFRSFSEEEAIKLRDILNEWYPK